MVESVKKRERHAVRPLRLKAKGADITKIKPLQNSLNLNIGSGIEHRKGWVNLDINEDTNPDKVADIRKLPYPDSTVDRIYLHHVLEHISGDLANVMQELYRVLKPGGSLEIHVPHFAFHGAHCHPEHVRRFDIHTFQHFTPSVLDDPKAQQYPKPKCRFAIIHSEYRYREIDHTNTKVKSWSKRQFIKAIDYMANKHKDSFDRFWCYWVGGCEEIIVLLTPIKPGIFLDSKTGKVIE